MKKLMFILAAVGFLFVSGLSYGAGPMENQGHQKGVSPLDDAGALTGHVINLNRAEGTLELRTAEKGITRIQVDKDHEGVLDQLKNVKPGDKVMVMLTMKAAAVEKKREGGTSEQAPPQAEAGTSRKTPLPGESGKLTGEVVELNRSEKSLDIKTKGGGITHVHLDEEAKGPWKNIKPGDRIEVTLTMEATSVEPKAPG